jgi:hypothetical protein
MKLMFLVVLNITLLIAENAFAQSEYSVGFIEIDKAAEAGIKVSLTLRIAG